MEETRVQLPGGGGDDPLEKGMATTLVFLPGESHGQRSLAGFSPWGRKESDTIEQLTFIPTIGLLAISPFFFSSYLQIAFLI